MVVKHVILSLSKYITALFYSVVVTFFASSFFPVQLPYCSRIDSINPVFCESKINNLTSRDNSTI